MIANIKEELRWSTDLIHRKNGSGFDGKFSFYLQSSPDIRLDSLSIRLVNGTPQYQWHKSAFSPGIKEYLEFKCQTGLDDHLRSLERSELRS